MAVLYPGPYMAAVNSLGHQMIYFIANSVEGVMAERFVTDVEGSVESGARLSDFDVVLITLHFEGQLHVLSRILRSEGLSPGRGPILIGGGPALSNPLPGSFILDACFLGDGEPAVPKMLQILAEGGSPEDLEGLGAFVRGRASFVRSSLSYVPDRQIEVHLGQGPPVNPFLLEVNRGCSRGCRFCLLGWTQRPRRDRPWSQLRDQVELASSAGFTKVYLIGSEILAHPRIADLLWLIVERGLSFSLPSLRADLITRDILEAARASGERTITVAPETGSVRLKRVINKFIENETLLDLARDARELGFKKMRVYLMAGLPFEEKEDLQASADLIRSLSTHIRVEVSLSPFVPKPFTPFQWAPMDRPEELRSKAKFLSSRVPVRVKVGHPGRAAVQALISLGGREVGRVVWEASA
ncbi:MAG: hypothetical protein DRO06_03595, partial [Thermoproteota archaeon]